MASMPLSSQNISLDETMELQSAAGGTLVEEDALDRLKAHHVEIAAFREDLKRLRSPGAGIAELRRLVEEAMALQAKLNVSPEMLTRDLLLQAGIPVEELEQARSILQGIQACDQASEQARSHLHGTCEAVAVDDLTAFLESLSRFRQLTGRVQQQKGRSAVADVDLGMEKRMLAASQLCEALIDKVSTSPNTELSGRMQHLYAQEWVKQELAALCVETPAWATGAPAASGRSHSPGPTASQPPTSGGRLPQDGRMASGAAAGTAATSVDTLADMVASQAVLQAPHPEDNSGFGNARSNAFDAREFTSNFGSAAMHSFGSEKAQGSTAGRGQEDFWRSPSAGVEESRDFASGSQPSAGSDRAAQIARQHGTQELWQAVHIGEEATIRVLIQNGLCHGAMMDASGHSVLWHSIAFNHIGIAKFMLDTFPPGSECGCDVAEVHQRRGDTLLHLLCQCRPFVAETAQLFKCIASQAPPPILEKENAQGFTFLHIACSTLNFWVLKYVCQHLASSSKALCCRSTPLLAVAEAIPKPAAPTCAPPVPIPEHLQLAHLLGHSSGRIPFADLAFDVGPEDAPSNSDEKGRFLAHRVVVGAQSSVLLEALENREVQDLPQEGIKACVFRVDPRISKEVWRSALQFLYTGVINCPFERDTGRMVELLRACAMYKLPKPLLDYAQSVIFQLLPQSSPMAALQVFSVAAGGAAEDLDFRSVRELAAYMVLYGASHAFEILEPAEVAKVLEKLVETVETSVFQPAAKSLPKGALKKTSPEAAQTNEAMQMQQMQMQQMQMQQMQMQMQAQGGQHAGYAGHSGYRAEAGHKQSYPGMPPAQTGCGAWQY